MCTHACSGIHSLSVALQIRDLDALRSACARRGWELRQDELTIAVPGCLYEVGLVDRGDHWQPVWDCAFEGGLRDVLGRHGRPLWRAYLEAKVRAWAEQHGYHVGPRTEAKGTFRLRVFDTRTDDRAHVVRHADGSGRLMIFSGRSPLAWGEGAGLRANAWQRFRDLADALGAWREEELTCE